MLFTLTLKKKEKRKKKGRVTNICKNINSAGVFGHPGDQHAMDYCLQHCQLQLAMRVHVVLIKVVVVVVRMLHADQHNNNNSSSSRRRKNSSNNNIIEGR